MTYYRGPLTVDDIRGIIVRVRAGGSYADVAARYHVSKQTITKYMQNADKYVAPPRRRRSLAWQDQAACRDVRGFTELPVQRQREWCHGCPVRAECLEYAKRFADGLSAWAKTEGPVYGGLHAKEVAELVKGTT
jgi:hypothetical protein